MLSAPTISTHARLTSLIFAHSVCVLSAPRMRTHVPPAAPRMRDRTTHLWDLAPSAPFIARCSSSTNSGWSVLQRSRENHVIKSVTSSRTRASQGALCTKQTVWICERVRERTMCAHVCEGETVCMCETRSVDRCVRVRGHMCACELERKRRHAPELVDEHLVLLVLHAVPVQVLPLREKRAKHSVNPLILLLSSVARFSNFSEFPPTCLDTNCAKTQQLTRVTRGQHDSGSSYLLLLGELVELLRDEFGEVRHGEVRVRAVVLVALLQEEPEVGRQRLLGHIRVLRLQQPRDMRTSAPQGFEIPTTNPQQHPTQTQCIQNARSR